MAYGQHEKILLHRIVETPVPLDYFIEHSRIESTRKSVPAGGVVFLDYCVGPSGLSIPH